MQQQALQFSYRPSLRELRLLQVAMFTGGLAMLLGGIFLRNEPMELALITLKPPFNTIVQWAGAIICFVAGVQGFRQHRSLSQRWLSLTVSSEEIRLQDSKEGKDRTLLSWSNLQWFRVRQQKRGRVLELRTTTESLRIETADLSSPDMFDALVNAVRATVPADKEQL